MAFNLEAERAGKYLNQASNLYPSLLIIDNFKMNTNFLTIFYVVWFKVFVNHGKTFYYSRHLNKVL